MDDVLEKEKAFLASKANVNVLVDIIEYSDSQNDTPDGKTAARTAIGSLRRIFSAAALKGELHKPASEEDTTGSSKIDRYKRWLWKQFDRSARIMLRHIRTTSDEQLQVLSLRSLLYILQSMGIHGYKNKKTIDASVGVLSEGVFPALVATLLGLPEGSAMIATFGEEYLSQYDDIRLYTLRAIHKMLERSLKEGSETTEESSNLLTKNAHQLLTFVSMPLSQKYISSFFCTTRTDDSNEGPSNKKARDSSVPSKAPAKRDQDRSHGLRMKTHRRAFSDAWLTFLRMPFGPDVYKSILLSVHTKVLPFLTDPLTLADFLTESYNVGGVVSVLALSGLFTLITRFGLEYPNFYEKLYALYMDEQVVYAKHRLRLFQLTDRCLRSTHLPASLLAAFCKRLLRVALRGPPAAAMFAMAVTHGLLRRHTTLVPLIHRSHDTAPRKGMVLAVGAEVADGRADPFNDSERDPAKCNALDSSLWEITALQKHACPVVAQFATIFSSDLKREAVDFKVADVADISYASLFRNQFKKRPKCDAKGDPVPPPVEYRPHDGLFDSSDVAFAGVWDMDGCFAKGEEDTAAE